MGTLTHVPLEAHPLDRLGDIIGPIPFERFKTSMTVAAERLGANTVWNVNSTAEGGGVAEMLSSLLPYCLDAGWDVRWVVMFGDEDFFEATKDLHNALHGSPPANGAWERFGNEVYDAVTQRNAEELAKLVRPGDVVLVHDPQAAGIIPRLADTGAHIWWQCHVGTDTNNDHTQAAWAILRPYVARAERYVFSRRSYLWEGLEAERLRVIPPSIDALAPKNLPLAGDEARSILRAAGILVGRATSAVQRRALRAGGEAPIPADARMVVQVSRWDRLKDPVGFIRMFDDHLSDLNDVHLVYAGPSTEGVDDDPEGAEVLGACEEIWRSLSPEVSQRVHLLSLPMDDIDENAMIVNALQRRADVIVQKSLEEGFGLTVSEAMWKSRPVVGSAVGGIQDQIEHGRSGLLVDDPYDIAAFGRAVRSVLEDPGCGRRLGAAAHERVRDNFLAPRQLSQYAELVGEFAA